METTKSDYEASRDKIDQVIQKASKTLEGELQTVVLARTEIIISLIKEWSNQYQELVQNVNISPDINKIIAKAYTEYFSYVFCYRILHKNINNILFTKIISFELHFFRKYNVLELKKNTTIQADSNADEILFYSSPLGHFTYYRLQKEYHLSPQKLDLIEAKERYDKLLHILQDSMTAFFSKYKNEIQLFDFLNFTQKPEQSNLKNILNRINNH